MSIIDNINEPADLKPLSLNELNQLADEVRDLIVERVSLNGGHLASNLGSIELTVALHHVFESPKDSIIWDVGHQAYAHKLLTGRRDRFETIRKEGGLSGFPKRSESIHDPFGTGHSSTSISAALGMMEGKRRAEISGDVIAVIGDGALTAGLAFEGLNHAGHIKKKLFVVLNDNDMSISPNVGALSSYLKRMITGTLYSKLKQETKHLLEGIPSVGESMIRIAHRAKGTVKGLVTPGMLFEELGFEYVGPVDGHRIEDLVHAFKRVRSLDRNRPTLIHVITQKGKGYEPAEKEPSLFHGVDPFDTETGEPSSRKGSPSYSRIFGETLCELARNDKKILAITAAMTEGTGLYEFASAFPRRFYDVGIAEPHAVTFAAGLACEGLRPVVAVYSTFLQRGYDQIIHDVCLQNLPVTFALDRAGLVGEDGPTHHGVFDMSYLRHIPNLMVMAPKDENDLCRMLKTALEHKGPSALRFPRGRAQGVEMEDEITTIPVGKAKVLMEGDEILIIAIGSRVRAAMEAAKMLKQHSDIRATVLDARFVKPLDEDLIGSLARKIKVVLTVEENALQGGFGSAVLEYLTDCDIDGLRIKRLGIPDCFIEQGRQSSLMAQLGLNTEGIAKAAKKFLTKTL